MIKLTPPTRPLKVYQIIMVAGHDVLPLEVFYCPAMATVTAQRMKDKLTRTHKEVLGIDTYVVASYQVK